jgi:mitochondrial fission protein ELM1
LHSLTAWVLTDGKAGDEGQCLGVTEALGLSPQIRRVAPRAPFFWLMPWGPIDPRDAPERPSSPIAPPFPDLLVASGRRAVPYVRAVKRASKERTFTVFLKDPRTGAGIADLIWAPEYDAIRGPNVFKTLTSPHRVSAERIVAARANPDPRLAALPHPRVAVLAGGHSRHLRYTDGDIRRFIAQLTDLARAGASLMATASRRTPPVLRDALVRLTAEHGGFFWDGTGENPYVALLALADAVVVTADSANMVGEAAATGAPVLLFELPQAYAKHRAFFAVLERHGAVKPFTGRLEAYAYEPLDSTPAIAQAVAAGLARHRRALGLTEADRPAV